MKYNCPDNFVLGGLMTRSILLLAHLNDIDLAVDATKTRLTEIAEALREPPALTATRRSAGDAEKEVDRLRTEQQSLERDEAELEQKVKKTEQRLYSGEVTSPRELKDGERDVAQHQHQKAAVEDQLLGIMMALETATVTLDNARAEVARLAAEWDARQATLRTEQARLKARLPGEQDRQAAARRGIPAEILRTYDTLRPRRGGRAVAELDGDECSACLVAVPPSKLEAARFGDELVYCGNCGRLLLGE